MIKGDDAMIKGADISSLLDVEECGGRFYDESPVTSHQSPGKAFPLGGRCPSAHTGADEGGSPPEDALLILQRHGVNLIRLRLWNDPYDDAGNPYGAGTNDLPRVMALARRCKALGLPWLLDFHYSDFWADPGKQYPPKAWASLDADGLERAVYDFTRETLETLGEAELLPAMVAPGNELSNGLLWPLGKVPNWANIARFVSAGVRAVRETAPEARVMLHLDNGGNNALYRSWFDSYLAQGGADFDCIGLSYYPFWHGSLEALRHNLHDLAGRYGKPMIVAETSMAFTLADCREREGLGPDQKRGQAANEKTAACVPYSATPAGQADFLRDLWAVIRSVPGGLGRGLIWWEPAWLPVPGAEWTKPAGLAYIHEKGPGGNEWANQGLFDYDALLTACDGLYPDLPVMAEHLETEAEYLKATGFIRRKAEALGI
ncbi:MAG: arabinogalactan endo-1,4-beta-galactosidase, partial [Oscillospiraceae bacterium]|nr:arabinogalactan endo-1,4-beta-galactosidase [Oscillospiraceae bacterium]